MFENLKNALYQKPMTMKSYASFLGVTEKTLQNKLNGTTKFTWDEVERTSVFLFPDIKIECLFEKGSDRR